MTQADFQPVSVFEPAVAALPLVCDSPHSGETYPADFGASASLAQLRQGEDTHVDALWSAAPALGATLVAANFPRVYIDPNRTLRDLDPELLAEPWPEPLEPGEKTRLGKGLIWRRMDKATPIYDRKLALAEVRHRIQAYYEPYHAALSRAIGDTVRRFGAVWHLNLHSMPNDAYERLGRTSPHPLADFVLGDRDGSTCEPEFIALIETALRAKGYTVARNDPYKGVQLIAQIGQPALNRHSLQVEIRRPLYMDETSRERNEGFEALRADLTDVLSQTAAYVRERIAATESTK